MQNIIQQTIEIISTGFRKNIKNLLETGQDISEFILETQKDLNSVGAVLVKEALEKADESVKSGKERKKDWHVKEKDTQNTLATIFGEAIETPYRRSGNKATEGIEISGQTVMNTIREFGALDNNAAAYRTVNKEARVIYVESDEDHVSLQRKGVAEPKLVYVHEGFREKGRFELINSRYFGGMYSNSDDLWEEVSDYINEVYDYEKIKKIYISGDGARYIKNGAKWLNKGIYVFDRFHLMKYIKKAAKYIMNNFESIKYHYFDDYGGCSAESHISHIYADRMSSRPLGWSIEGVEQMTRLRVFKKNGGNIYALMLKKKSEIKKEQLLGEQNKKVLKLRKKVACGETLGNIEVLNIGKCSRLQKVLKSLR